MNLEALRQDFRAVWLVDFEFHQPDGERPEPICMVATELFSGRTLKVWQDELSSMRRPPFPVGDDTLFVAYYASAELGCFLALGWPMPARVLDLYAEFRNTTNGLPTPCGRNLLGALAYYGLDGLDAVEKKGMQELAMRGGPFSEQERKDLLVYCATDVQALKVLLPKMLPDMDLPRALLRGRYLAAVARMEWNGTPVDVETLTRLRTHWATIQERLIARIDADYGIYDGRTFKRDRFAEWLIRGGIPWPVLDSGNLALDDDTFRQMSKAYPAVASLRELRHTLGALRLESLAVGSDARNRCLLSPFQSKTARNQPSNTKFIFGPSCWMRSLIKPGPGRAVAYIDYGQQEFGIAAALAGDDAMCEAYASGDPYLTFAQQAGAAPPGATKQSHKEVRERFKQCALGVQYGMGEKSLAARIGQPEAAARELLRLHRRTYPKFWGWSDAAVMRAMLHGKLHTTFGWQVRVGENANPRSLANFPVQANGSEMLRLLCCMATEAGITVCAPVHDAILIEASLEEIESTIAVTRELMAEASRIVLDGFCIRTDVEIVRYPDRYMDDRGTIMWQTITELLDECSPRKQAEPQAEPQAQPLLVA